MFVYTFCVTLVSAIPYALSHAIPTNLQPRVSLQVSRRQSSGDGPENFRANVVDIYNSVDDDDDDGVIFMPWLTPTMPLPTHDPAAASPSISPAISPSTISPPSEGGNLFGVSRDNVGGNKDAGGRKDAEGDKDAAEVQEVPPEAVSTAGRGRCSRQCGIATVAVPVVLITLLLGAFVAWRRRNNAAQANGGGRGAGLKQVRLDVVRNPLLRLKNSFKRGTGRADAGAAAAGSAAGAGAGGDTMEGDDRRKSRLVVNAHRSTNLIVR